MHSTPEMLESGICVSSSWVADLNVTMEFSNVMTGLLLVLILACPYLQPKSAVAMPSGTSSEMMAARRYCAELVSTVKENQAAQAATSTPEPMSTTCWKITNVLEA
jgi:hypothetical protein